MNIHTYPLFVREENFRVGILFSYWIEHMAIINQINKRNFVRTHLRCDPNKKITLIMVV